MDKRSFTIILSEKGKQIVELTDSQLDKSPINELENTYKTLSQLIYQLNTNGILTDQRICFSCKHFDKSTEGNHCKLLDKELLQSEIRLDCDDYSKSGW